MNIYRRSERRVESKLIPEFSRAEYDAKLKVMMAIDQIKKQNAFHNKQKAREIIQKTVPFFEINDLLDEKQKKDKEDDDEETDN